MSDMKKLLEAMDSMSKSEKKSAGPKFPGYLKGTDPASKVRDKMVGSAQESVIKELAKTAKETSTERKLAEEFASFNESALKDKADYNAKAKALQDLSMNKDVDQKVVQQRKLDLDKEAKAKGLVEGEVVQFPKKHRGDLEGFDDCPKCGGDLQGGKYMGHKVKVCMPCKQVYLPPNSNIDQQGNEIKEQDDSKEAWAAGYKAFHDHVAKCPYAPGTEQAREWGLGWESAQARGWDKEGVAEGLESEDPKAKTLGKFAYYAITAKGKDEPQNPYPAGTQSAADFDEGYEAAYDGQTRNLLSASAEQLVRFYNVADRLQLLKQGVAEETDAPTKYRATVEYGPTAADAHFVTVTANSTEEAEAKVQKWCEKKGVRNPMITINGADKPIAEGSQAERKIARTQALIQDYYNRSRETSNDIKRDHYIDMARQLEYELEGLINDANQAEQDGYDVAQHDAEPSATWNRGGLAEQELDEKSVSKAQFRTMAAAAKNPKFAKKVGISSKVAKEFHKADKGANYKSLPAKVNESEYQELRKLQQQWWVALPEIMKKAGIKYQPVQELDRDYYPVLGTITFPEDQFIDFHVNANPKGDSAKINISIDVGTSNSLFRHSQPQKAAKLNAFAEKIAQALGGTHEGHRMTGERKTHPGVGAVVANLQLPKEPAEWQNPSQGRYDPKARFLSQPGERARQARVARSANPDSFGGDSSNYTRFNEGADGVDAITMDVPLMIRLFEYAREDAKTDMDLHDVAERLIALSQEGRTLTMQDYDTICPSQEQAVGEEQEAEYGDKYQASVKRMGQKAKEQEKKKPVDIAALAAKLAAMNKQVKELKEVTAVAPTGPTTAGGAPATQQGQATDQEAQDLVNTQKNLAKLKTVNPQLNPGLANQALQNIATNPQAPVAGAQMAQTKNLADLVGDALADPQKGPQVATMLSQVQQAQKLKK